LDEAGRELLGLLDGLPLALAQAASYIRETGLDTASYVRLYKQQWDDLMRYDGESDSPLVDYEQGSVGTTWTVSFKAVEAKGKTGKTAANLLRLWAFVDNRDLWHGLLQWFADGGEQWPAWLCEIAGNEVRYLEAVRLLLRYSMIEAGESVQGSHMMHPVVHRWASHIQDGAAKSEVLRLAVIVVGFSVPSSTSKDYWVLQRRLLPHAERCWWWIGEICSAGGSFDDITAIDAIHMLGLLYQDQGRLTEAESIYQLALEDKEKALGRDHVSTLETINNIGNLYAKQGRREAESMYQRALQGYEKEFGPDHISTLNTVNNLGTLYADQGRLPEAESMCQRALQGQEKALGRGHISTLNTVNNLGTLYQSQGRLEAESMFQRALEGYEKELGRDHTSTLDTVNNLGVLYATQGRLAEAESMYQRALQGWEKELGRDHIDTLDTVNNLGNLYMKQGRLAEAESMYQRALEGFLTALGPSHKKSQIVMGNMDRLQHAKGIPKTR
jgi:tetratricopeptide (TPR) repeat protein